MDILPTKVKFNARHVFIDFVHVVVRLKSVFMHYILASLIWNVGIFEVFNVGQLVLVLCSIFIAGLGILEPCKNEDSRVKI